MELIKWEPLSELDRLFGDRHLAPSFPRMGMDLSVDVFEEKGNVVAKMTLPGVKAEEVEVFIEDDILTISGRREEEKEVNEKNYYSKEIRRGSFSRTVALPKLVDADRAEAKCEEGVLTVTMPAITGLKERGVKIEVK